MVTAQPGQSEIRSLTGFRFIAALYVFLFHCHSRWPIVGKGWLSNFLSQGAVGMTMFFMLSGFILTHRYGAGSFDPRQYL